MRKFKQGVSQGAVLSPTIFNLYISSMPKPRENVALITHADDHSNIRSTSD